MFKIKKTGSNHIFKRKLDNEYKGLGTLPLVGRAGAGDKHPAPRTPEAGLGGSARGEWAGRVGTACRALSCLQCPSQETRGPASASGGPEH